MKPGARAVGVAESYTGDASTLAGVVARRDRAVESVSFGQCTVGGSDATVGVGDVVESLERPDARYVLVAGVALAWYNLLDLDALHERLDRPVLAVTFEASESLEPALRDAFDGDALDARLDAYHALPARRAVRVARDDASVEGRSDVVYVRAVGIGDEHAAEVVRAFTHESGRPEPVRVAREVARAGDALRRGD
ncbi:DUF99 family protein [Halorubellus litoreus]|uniref:UPF0215 protein ACFQGB_03110 n=1 Tax=Halorubellus litoreus TaxID=755308 RepID=A0ABD5VF68_9EURY